ncbi:MAG: hypothetical protein ABIQ88_11835 [Chitinophagaceae bacterium]
MKKVLFACALFVSVSSFANETPVSEKALKAFETTFADAQNVVWTDAENVYTVTFTQQGISTFVRYDDQGNFLTSRRYYQPSKLPIDIQCKILKKFSGKTIFGVTEYTIGDDVSYFVKLEDADSWTSIKVNNARDIEVMDKYKKQ